ncbi:MAG: sensor domain-containing protein, partial [Actinomycetota bacterium]|nr:sensor domain-containing protein [Actinomycetota bacterium]
MASRPDPAILTRADGAVSSPATGRRPIMKRMGPILRTFWRDLAYQISGLPASILAFTVIVAGLSVFVSFAILIVGLPVALGCFAVFRWNAGLERKRTAWALGRPIREAYRPRTGGWLRYL